jgi:tRNA (adenine22-N1)-methyltransferase
MDERGRPRTFELPPRLAAVAEAALPASRIADVGTDHGLLPVRLLLAGRVSFAVATERTEPRLASARRLAAKHGLAGLDLRAGEGLEPLRAEDLLEVLVLAGMGGRSIRRILEPARLAALGPPRLVLQPQTCRDEVRRHLDEIGFLLDGERVVEDRGRRYVVLSASPRFTRERAG